MTVQIRFEEIDDMGARLTANDLKDSLLSVSICDEFDVVTKLQQIKEASPPRKIEL